MRCTNLIELIYTNDDDGVHAICDYFNEADTYCGFDKPLGYRPGLKDVAEAQQDHDRREGRS